MTVPPPANSTTRHNITIMCYCQDAGFLKSGKSDQQFWSDSSFSRGYLHTSQIRISYQNQCTMALLYERVRPSDQKFWSKSISRGLFQTSQIWIPDQSQCSVALSYKIFRHSDRNSDQSPSLKAYIKLICSDTLISGQIFLTCEKRYSRGIIVIQPVSSKNLFP